MSTLARTRLVEQPQSSPPPTTANLTPSGAEEDKDETVALRDSPDRLQRDRAPLSRRLRSALLVASPSSPRTTVRKKDFGFLPIPRNRRHEPGMKPEEQFVFTWRLNLLFAGSATVSVMNLYYIQPMLVKIARDFGVDNDVVSNVPTLSQGGYGCGILFISTLGDLVRRRQLVLLLMFLTTTLSIGLALSTNVHMLEGLSFMVGMLTVTPQLCIPWTADLAPSNRRARAMSITFSGLITGLVLGRVLAGVISDFASWRDVYWMAVGLQGLTTLILWLGLPDTPDKNIGMTYLGVLVSMAKYLVTYPTLTQACLMAMCSSAVFAGFWVDLTFLLTAEPYHYSSLTIGLLGLLGLFGALLAPQWGRLVDKIVPWLAQFLGLLTNLIAMSVALGAADRSVGAVCVAIILYDCGQQLFQVASSYRIAGIDPQARARLNGCYLLFVFIGQTSGTAILTKIYNRHGWRPTGATTVAFVGAGIILLFFRGPYETRWIGWRGGYKKLWKKAKLTDLSPNAITEIVHEKKRDRRPDEEVVMGNVASAAESTTLRG
ncbi:major facilitator superfamily domain-containing protein [Kockovaella imperatae]|uniref:Major facilitator superfamily domain-containing protein n=1 Tax=Kockovaella imperatae TaxID=4999 RepID=A0A1Y1U5U4_9TREE|nr:major facilitator superfamily domain-containing protein [Kockovaella imperatae]ORX33411.1 major facilitator superfamily domain-containing protein [Kockovaella imperatae]